MDLMASGEKMVEAKIYYLGANNEQLLEQDLGRLPERQADKALRQCITSDTSKTYRMDKKIVK